MLATKPLLYQVPIRPNQKRLPKGKAVTISVGFRCEDGIVICADTQITWPQSHKCYECKIYEHRTDDWTLVNTFSGDPEVVKAFNENFDEAMPHASKPHTARQIRKVIESVLSQMDDVSDLSMLCAVAIPQTEMHLYKTSAKIVREVDSYDYIGAGDSSLLRYLGSLLTESVVPSGYGSEYAYNLGCYFVLKAKVFIEGCGGDTTAWILRPHGHVDVRDGNTYNTEQDFMWLEKTFRMAVAACFDPRVPERNVNDLLGKMVEKLKQHHQIVQQRTIWPIPTQEI
jgi:20S proteasome alpha/beta subunit